MTGSSHTRRCRRRRTRVALIYRYYRSYHPFATPTIIPFQSLPSSLSHPYHHPFATPSTIPSPPLPSSLRHPYYRCPLHVFVIPIGRSVLSGKHYTHTRAHVSDDDNAASTTAKSALRWINVIHTIQNRRYYTIFSHVYFRTTWGVYLWGLFGGFRFPGKACDFPSSTRTTPSPSNLASGVLSK